MRLTFGSPCDQAARYKASWKSTKGPAGAAFDVVNPNPIQLQKIIKALVRKRWQLEL
jgi:hypothetical protein